MMKNNLPIQIVVTSLIIGAIVIFVWFTPTINTTDQAEVTEPNKTGLSAETETSTTASEHVVVAVETERMVKVSHVTKPVNKPATISEMLASITIVGVEASINMQSAAAMEREVSALWKQFRENEALHHNVNWASKPKIYAHYHGFNQAVTEAVLSIGYSLDALQLSSFENKHSISSNEYQIKHNVSQSELMLQWQSIKYPVSDVVERYALDSSGDITQIDFLYAQ